MSYQKLYLALLTTSFVATTSPFASHRSTPVDDEYAGVSRGSQSTPSHISFAHSAGSELSAFPTAESLREGAWSKNALRLLKLHVSIEAKAKASLEALTQTDQTITRLSQTLAKLQSSPSSVLPCQLPTAPTTTKTSVIGSNKQMTKALYDSLLTSYELWETYLNQLKQLEADKSSEEQHLSRQVTELEVAQRQAKEQVVFDAKAAELPLENYQTVLAQVNAQRKRNGHPVLQKLDKNEPHIVAARNALNRSSSSNGTGTSNKVNLGRPTSTTEPQKKNCPC